MINLENIFVVIIYLFFPFLVYLVILSYTTNYSFERNNFYLTLSLFSTTFLVLRYGDIGLYSYLLYSIPILISFLTNKYKSAILLSIILAIYFLSLDISIYLLVIENFLYFLFYKKYFNKKDFPNKMILIFLSMKTSIILLTLLKYEGINIINILSLIIILLITKILVNIIKFFLDKTSKIKELADMIKELEKEKNLKVSIFKLTHELKNPLAVCNGYLDMMDLSNLSKSTKYFNIVKDEIKRSLSIINDFSSFGKIKNIEKEEIDICYLIEDIKDTLDSLYKENNAKIITNFKDEIYIEADYNRLKQVFINLLKNSLEAKTSADLIVKILIRELKESVKVTIKDNGCGISKDALKHLGETFFTTKSNGTGLGLSYCQEIITLHKGNISFKSEKEKGTTVTIILPKEKKS